MPLNPDQFHEHINQMEMGGVGFPGPGVVSMGGRAFPASRVEHLRHEGATPGGGDGWYTDIHLPDERHGRDHLLMVNRADSASAPSSMIFHPAASDPSGTPGPNSGSMFWQANDPPHDSRAKRGLVVNSSEEFMERLPEMIRNAPAAQEGERPTGGTRMRSPQPFHRVEVHTSEISEAHEYDPRSRSLTRDPENDYRP
jgi:hypothetical protein